MTAISSAHHDQDLFKISESSIREVVRRNLAYSYWVEVYYASGDEEDPEEREIFLDGKRIWLLHGHTYQVKLGIGMLMNEARALATKRMVADAEALEADAIVAMRYLSASVAQGAAEVMAYGTAVKFL